ncbi:unnamed protein product [Caenorhabditis angaria]|uniref:Abnormal cell migration protein 18-like fibronectin type I domain-containing protein n=1 Tax=Caenorhabditis angaria TaxID=860376 RepID=A0A9P1IFJ9_9PELO|nr:unnamed protein product [Caenorhabditis angaria]
MSIFLLFSILIIINLRLANSEQFDIELLPENCDCRDYYGKCRKNGEKWVDDEGIWKYECDQKNTRFLGCEEIRVGENRTIDGLWYSCEQVQDIKLKYSIEPHCTNNEQKIRVGEEYRDGTFQWLCLSTGKWITGCYYSNETQSDILLRVGESAYNGLIQHVCEKRQEYPAIVQYFTQVRKDVDVKHPTNKGANRNFPEPIQKIINDDENVRWLHKSANFFIKNDEKPREFVRYLEKSRKPL